MMINVSTMKLFGRTIFLTHNHIDVSSNDSSLEFATHIPYEDLSDHSLHSSLSSSSPLEVNSQTSTSLEKKMNVGSHEETFDKSSQSLFPPQFPWNPTMFYPVL
jgi:hypothetical protein